MTLHPMEFVVFIFFVPCSFRLARVNLLGRRKFDEVLFDQFLKNNIQWLTKGGITSGCMLEFRLLASRYIDGICLVIRPLEVRPRVIALIALLLLLWLIDRSWLVMLLIGDVVLGLQRANNIHMSGIKPQQFHSQKSSSHHLLCQQIHYLLSPITCPCHS